MNINANHTTIPAWLTLASGTMKAIQHRQTPPHTIQKMERDALDPPFDDPLSDLLGAPDPLPPMVDLAEEWITMNETDDRAFCVRRPDALGKTLQLLATLRLCATLTDVQTTLALSDPAAITVLDVGHPDWIPPISRAVQDVLPDTLLFYTPDSGSTADMLVLAPQAGDNLATLKDAARFARTISEGLECEVPILIITAGHRGLPDRIANILPPARRLAPLDADIILAMMHLRFEDGDARQHAEFRRALPPQDMLARLGVDALNAAFREPDGAAIVAALSDQATALMPTDGPTLDQMSDTNKAVLAARQMVADLKLWSEGQLAWSDCLHSMLLYGQPGTGKTFLARAMGRSGSIPLISASFARWQACGHLGDMLRAMTETFADAIAAAPCVLFIDEIDAAGSRESQETHNGHYRRQVINGFLEQVDIAIRAEGVLIIGACNHVTTLDPAILRPGRFDSHIEMPLPGRDELAILLAGQLGDTLEADDLPELVNAATGMTPAVIDAAIRSARSLARSASKPLHTRDVISHLQGGETPDRTLMWRIAIHECGHAIVAVERDVGTLCHVRLGHRDGHTRLSVDLGAGLLRDHKNYLAYVLGGRAAEQVNFGSTGSGSGGNAQTCDLADATRMALAMETEHAFGADGLVWSPSETHQRIDDPVLRAAVRNRLDDAEAEARRVLQRHRVLLLEMAKDLMRHRLLDGADLQLWVDRITGDAPWDPDDPSGRRKTVEQPAPLSGGEVIDLAAHRLQPQ
ncbi:AAA family ATPase [Roseovarius mucosus]|uniref:AAA family ATPase n=1 Tax=Roseovarius mucosus TaxID=215743 RepID=UPI0035D018FF